MNKKQQVAIAAVIIGLAFLSGCAINIQVNPVSRPEQIAKLCILHNSDILMDEFEPTVQRLIGKNGIDAVIVNSPLPEGCQYHMEYVANWRWDLAMYLYYAEFRVYDGPNKIASAEYDARWGGGRPDKFGHTEAKIEPLLDKLFARPKAISARP
jgi:hypothetical protein